MINHRVPPSEVVSREHSTPAPIVLAGGGRTLRPGYIHLGAPRRLPDPARLRHRFDPVIREAGLDPRLFNDGTNVIPHVALGQLLTLCVTRTTCPHPGL